MKEVVCIVGLDQGEYAEIRERVDAPIIAHEALPPMMVHDGQLFIESDRTMQMLPVSKVVFHGIYENDLDFITGLALWGGPVLPNAHDDGLSAKAAVSGEGAAIYALRHLAARLRIARHHHRRTR